MGAQNRLGYRSVAMTSSTPQLSRAEGLQNSSSCLGVGTSTSSASRLSPVPRLQFGDAFGMSDVDGEDFFQQLAGTYGLQTSQGARRDAARALGQPRPGSSKVSSAAAPSVRHVARSAIVPAGPVATCKRCSSLESDLATLKKELFLSEAAMDACATLRSPLMQAKAAFEHEQRKRQEIEEELRRLKDVDEEGCVNVRQALEALQRQHSVVTTERDTLAKEVEEIKKSTVEKEASEQQQQQEASRLCLSESDFQRMRAELVTVIAQKDQPRSGPDSELEETRGRFMASELQVQQQARLLAQSKRIISDLEHQLAASMKEGQQLKVECHTLKSSTAPQLEDLQRQRREAAASLDAKHQELLQERAARAAAEKLLTERDDELQLAQLGSTQVKLDADDRVEAMRKQLVQTCSELDAVRKEVQVLRLVAADREQLFSNQKAQLQDKDDKFELLRSELERFRSDRAGTDVNYMEAKQSLQRAEAHIEVLQQQVAQSKHSVARKQDVLGAIGEHLRKAAGLETQPEPEAEVDEDEVLKLFYSRIDKLTQKLVEDGAADYDEDAVQKVLSAAASGPQADASAKAAMVAMFAGTSTGVKASARLSATSLPDTAGETPSMRRLPGQRREALSVVTSPAMEQALEQLAVAHESSSPKCRSDGQRRVLRRSPSAAVKNEEVVELPAAVRIEADVQKAETVTSETLLQEQCGQTYAEEKVVVRESDRDAEAVQACVRVEAGAGLRNSGDGSDIDKGFDEESEDAFPTDGLFTLDLQAARGDTTRANSSGKRRSSAMSELGTASMLSSHSFSSQRFTMDLTDFYDLDSPRVEVNMFDSNPAGVVTVPSLPSAAETLAE